MYDQIKVMVVDVHSLFRVGIIHTLESDQAIKVVGQASSGADAIQLTAVQSPDIVLLDIAIPGDGIETAKAIRAASAQTKIMILTMSEAETDIVRAVEAGVVGYVLKTIDAAELVPIVKSIAAGASFFAPGLTMRLVSYLKQPSITEVLSSLTDLEERTLRLVSNGLSNREVGAILGILEKTVKYHMTKTMAKLGVRNRVEATLVARQGWGIATSPTDVVAERPNTTIAGQSSTPHRRGSNEFA